MANDQPAASYDVAILGGGLAGLTLGAAAQAAAPRDERLHRREARRPRARGRVQGRRVDRRGLRALLRRGARPPRPSREATSCTSSGCAGGSRPDGNRDLAQRIERGINRPLDHPSYQLDRGRFENFLGEKNLEAGVDLFGGARVQDVELAGDRHKITGTDCSAAASRITTERERTDHVHARRRDLDDAGALGRRRVRPLVHAQEAARAARGQRPQRQLVLVPARRRARHRGLGRPRRRGVLRPHGRARACAGSAPTTSAARATGSG